MPFLVRDELAHIFALPRDRVRVLTARVGGGFGGKQEMLTEDLVALAVLRTGRPVQYELPAPRSSPSRPAGTRCASRCGLGADADGVLTALRVDVLTDTGAYGNHGPGVMFHGCHESVARVPVRRTSGSTPSPSTPTTLPSGAFRGYGLGQVIFAIESAHGRTRAAARASTRSSCAAATSSSPATAARRPTPTRRRPRHAAATGSTSASTSSRSALADAGDDRAGAGRHWRVGEGMAVGHDRDHPAARALRRGVGPRCCRRRPVRVGVGTAEFGNGTTTVHAQLVAQALGTDRRPDR